MTIAELEEIMVKEGLVVRAMPKTIVGIYERTESNIKNMPNGKIVYLEKFKREMLVVEKTPKAGGKFFVTSAKNTNSTVCFKNETFDSIEEAIENYLNKKG